MEDINDRCFLDRYNFTYVDLRTYTAVLKSDFRFSFSKSFYIF